MEIIGSNHLYKNSKEVSDFLIANETNAEIFTSDDTLQDMGDSSMKITVDSIKLAQSTSKKFTDLFLNECDGIKKSISGIGAIKLNELNPMQYPFFHKITHSNSNTSSNINSAIFICGTIGLILSMRYRKKTQGGYISHTSDNDDDKNSTKMSDSDDSDNSIEIVSENKDLQKNKSRGIFTNWFGFNSLY